MPKTSARLLALLSLLQARRDWPGALLAERLEVSAACKYPQESQRYLRHDWRVGSWHVEIALPRRVDPSAARATLNLGVLMVMAPLSEVGGPAASLDVEASAPTPSGTRA